MTKSELRDLLFCAIYVSFTLIFAVKVFTLGVFSTLPFVGVCLALFAIALILVIVQMTNRIDPRLKDTGKTVIVLLSIFMLVGIVMM